MFSALRQGGTIYVLEKGETPTLHTGSVISVSSPGSFGTFVSTVDVTAKLETGDTVDYKLLPSSLSVANYNNGLTIVCETKELMNSEVETLLRNSLLILDSIPFHERAVISYEEMLKQLNPQFAKLKLLEEKISSLESKVDGIENKLDGIKDMLSKALNK